MKKSLLTLLALAAVGLSACMTTPPADIVVAIQNSCVIDAGIRPTVTALEVLATPMEVQAINAARAIIDPICANPSASVQANTLTILATNVGNIQGILVALQIKKSAGK
ncbi:hypothetical protein A4F89_03630 [Polynucleobacter asymbioticus]|uniref:hypothetical protein n=1 Tax=Polynucleobacter asymbioticus TaxID=576611 RepID=UPI0008FB6D03|nr:hypothetical protein [Polynucleobacter asymbioticus]APB98499.1 hypothetical protein A4F89_03630 [Polynucleobacter asymbioticus]